MEFRMDGMGWDGWMDGHLLIAVAFTTTGLGFGIQHSQSVSHLGGLEAQSEGTASSSLSPV